MKILNGKANKFLKNSLGNKSPSSEYPNGSTSLDSSSSTEKGNKHKLTVDIKTTKIFNDEDETDQFWNDYNQGKIIGIG